MDRDVEYRCFAVQAPASQLYGIQIPRNAKIIITRQCPPLPLTSGATGRLVFSARLIAFITLRQAEECRSHQFREAIRMQRLPASLHTSQLQLVHLLQNYILHLLVVLIDVVDIS